MPNADGLLGLDLSRTYESKRGDARNILTSFLIPVLSRSVEFSRTVGYFSSSLLESAAAGISHFVHNGGTMRLLVGAQVYAHDVDALTGKISVDGDFGRRLAAELVPADEIAKRRLEVLAWLYKEQRLEIRIAIALDPDGHEIVVPPDDTAAPYWHEKVGFFRDKYGETISYTGSINDSRQALERNKEHLTVFPGWLYPEFVNDHVAEFEEKWRGKVDDFRILPLPKAAEQQLITFAPLQKPALRDVLEPKVDNKALLATVLDLAPRLPNAQALAEVTTSTVLQPHQRQVQYRLADLYPRSWIVADEVGLGKTISSGMSLRRLILGEQVKRVLILAPANVCVNWQNELFEKFGLWVPRLKDNAILGAHPSQQEKLKQKDNPFLKAPLLIVSSHLARRQRHADLLMDAAAAAPYDLIIVDEAHHARIEGNDERRGANRLLRLIQRINQRRVSRTLWLLTATPLQLHPLELYALLRQVGMGRPFDDYATFERYYVELTKGSGANWEWLQQKLRMLKRPEDPDEEAYLRSLSGPLTADNVERIRRFTSGTLNVEQTVQHPDFTKDAQKYLHTWLRLHGPVERHMTRHTRETLREYIRDGKLDKPLARRDVRSINIRFRPDELALHDRLAGFIQRLQEAHGANRQAGFVLQIYQRRLTSSWAAIEASLRKRLNQEALIIEDDDDDYSDDVSDAESLEQTVDQVNAVPLTPAEMAEIRDYIEQLNAVRDGDTKFEELEKCVDEARGSGQRIIVFTQFTDTLNYLREKLVGKYGHCMATYTGDGGRRFTNGEWEKIPKEDLVEAVGAGSVQILLANDAAAEGLNLQACSYLVNYDMPWNPMRAEQRIGRIDRLGQLRAVVTVRNFFVSELERDVYRALADRILDFNRFIGGLPPILGVVEEGFIRNPLDEQKREPELMDQLPLPEYPTPPLTYEQFVTAVRDELGLDASDDPINVITWQPDRASRDKEHWRAAATYGHPQIQQRIREFSSTTPEPLVAASDDSTGVAVITRADRVPAEQITQIAQINDLGEAVNLAEARDLADTILAQRNANIRRYYSSIQVLQEQGGLESLRADYIRLMRDIVSLRIGLSLHTAGLEMSPKEAWGAIEAEGQKDGSIIPYLADLRGILQISDGQMFEGLDIKPVNEAQYYRRFQARETDATVIFDTIRAFREANAS